MPFVPSIPILLAAVEDGRWVMGIGDPTPMGWVTVAAYLLAAAICVVWAKPTGRGRLLPLALAAAMALLAVNKQLDLQSLLTEMGRDLARAQGWYEDRREFQTAFIAGFAGLAGVGFVLVAWLLRGRFRECMLAVLGLGFLLAFVAVRAASFHRVDQGLGDMWAGWRFNWILELGGIALVGSGALVGWRVRRGRPAMTAGSPVKAGGAILEAPAARVEEALPALRAAAKSLDGFVIRPIRLSSGPTARDGDPPRATSPPSSVS